MEVLNLEAKDIQEAEVLFERYEAIDGTIYDMSPPPSSQHQTVVGNLYREISVYLKGHACRVFPAPFGVWMTSDEQEHVEPDITVVCDREKIHTKGYVGVPDFIVEVLSPSTAVKDKTVKLRLYRKAGVREYWIIDPSNEIVEVYPLQDSTVGEPQVYGKNAIVNVGIFDDLSINLTDIFS